MKISYCLATLLAVFPAAVYAQVFLPSQDSFVVIGNNTNNGSQQQVNVTNTGNGCHRTRYPCCGGRTQLCSAGNYAQSAASGRGTDRERGRGNGEGWSLSFDHVWQPTVHNQSVSRKCRTRSVG